MNVTDLVATESFSACKKPEVEGTISKFQDFIFEPHPSDVSNPQSEKAPLLSKSVSDSFEEQGFYNFLNALSAGDLETLLADPVAPEAAIKTFVPSPSDDHVGEQSFFHLDRNGNPISENPDKKDAAPDTELTSTIDSFAVTKRLEAPIKFDINKDGLSHSAQLKTQPWHRISSRLITLLKYQILLHSHLKKLGQTKSNPFQCLNQ
ncbi:hypothetical protein ACMAY7_17485 [Rhodobacteraceae bacterium nBUS_24]